MIDMTTTTLGSNIWPAELAVLSIDGPGKLTDDIRTSNAFTDAGDIPDDADLVVQYEYEDDFGSTEANVYVRGITNWRHGDTEDGYEDRTYASAELPILMFRDRLNGMVFLSSTFTGATDPDAIARAPRGSIAIAPSRDNTLVVLHSLGGYWVDISIGIESEVSGEKLPKRYPYGIQLLWTAPGDPIQPTVKDYELHDEVRYNDVPGYISAVDRGAFTFVYGSNPSAEPVQTTWKELTLVKRPERPLTADAARYRHLAGASRVCITCGDHGAETAWAGDGEKLYFCSTHLAVWHKEDRRHIEATKRLRTVNFQQD
jgi:hypothetical protein